MSLRVRRFLGILLLAIGIGGWFFQMQLPHQVPSPPTPPHSQVANNTNVSSSTTPSNSTDTRIESPQTAKKAIDVLKTLSVKGRAPKTDYRRTQFGDGWSIVGVCDMRNIILNRDLTNPIINDKCKVMSGTLNDPYTGVQISFLRGADSSDDVQIDHVVALSDAWQKGAQGLTLEQRILLANDPLELLAVDGNANQAKGDGDAATWLPANKAFRCQYVSRQIAVKAKYGLWVTEAEKSAMEQVLNGCPDQTVPVER